MSFAIAIAAKKRQVGMYKALIVSLLLTPLIGYFYYANSKNRNYYYDLRYKCPSCNYQFTENHSNCPFCAKEGKNIPLKGIVAEMT